MGFSIIPATKADNEPRAHIGQLTNDTPRMQLVFVASEAVLAIIHGFELLASRCTLLCSRIYATALFGYFFLRNAIGLCSLRDRQFKGVLSADS